VDARLIPVNAFIALTSSRSTSWPNPLYEVGYRLEGLEVPVSAGGGRIEIDAVAFNPATNWFLNAEGKSGNNIEDEQARRYGQVDPADLVRLTGVTITKSGDLSAAVLYVCLEESVDRIRVGLASAGCEYPVLSVGSTHVALHGEPDDPALLAALADPIDVPGPPPGVILVDDHSDDSAYDAIVSAALVAALARGEESIACPDLAKRAIPYLDFFAKGHRSKLVGGVTRAARRAAEASPETFEFRPPTAAREYAMVKVTDSPEQADPRGRTQRYQALKHRLAGTVPQADDLQGMLFDEFDLAVELEKADTGEQDADIDEGEEVP
jgi:hypothetical protein